MQTVTSETESKSLDLSICVHHYTLRAPCPKGQGIMEQVYPVGCNFKACCQEKSKSGFSCKLSTRPTPDPDQK